MRLRYSIELDAPAAENMRRDEALMRSAGPGLRIYTWQPPAITLGQSQRHDILDLDACAAEGIAVLHRFTGGAAVLHKEDLTYAFFYPAGLEPRFRAADLRIKFRDAMLAAFRASGVEAAGSDNPKWVMPASAICFHGQAANEILIGGRKVAGNAQRITRAGIFQHGSILLRNTESLFCRLVRGAQPEGTMTGLLEHAPGLTAADLAERLARAVAAEFGMDLARG